MQNKVNYAEKHAKKPKYAKKKLLLTMNKYSMFCIKSRGN